MMRPVVLLAVTGLLALASAAAANETMQQLPNGDTLLTLSASATVKQAPDMAMLSAGVQSVALAAADAMADNAAAMTKIIAAAREAGIATRDIQTDSVLLSPRFAPSIPANSDSERRITGYVAANTIVIQAHHLDTLGKTMDALVKAGANMINGPEYKIDKLEPPLDKARRLAVASARSRADLYAAAAGLHVRRIIAIRENGFVPPRPISPFPLTRFMPMSMNTTPIAAGETSLTASVEMDFDLTP